MSKLPSRATLRIREALEELLERTDEMQRREVTEMFLGPDIFVALLRRPQVVEGEWEDTERTVDLLDLMEHFGDGRGSAAVVDAPIQELPAEQPSVV